MEAIESLHTTETQEPPDFSTSNSDEPPSACSAVPNVITILPSRNVVHKPATTSKTKIFRKLFYPDVIDSQWNDWRWQIANRIRTYEQLSAILDLSQSEVDAITSHTQLPMSITPYYASLIDRTNPNDPIRRCVVPTIHELSHNAGESNDPLSEDEDSPVPGLVHRYPDRVLFLVTDFCSTYCRYCTRSRIVGRSNCILPNKNWDAALRYIAEHTQIRDVLISGGDPLTMNDSMIEYLLNRLRAIPHVEIIRIGTKVPAVLPQRITHSLVSMLRKYHPLWINIHFTHPNEITPETMKACNRLANAGIPLGSQTVLLKGINDSVDVLKKLYHLLLQCRVRPYYLYQCDPIVGSYHFRTSVAKGIEMIAGLRGHTTGLAVPHYVIDAPGGGGKIPLLPQYCQGVDDDSIVLKNYEHKYFYYPDTK
ncbi:MAG: KamA family radical SAM protein [Spirochaetes bacterium]|nr:KamA family radical SAM protein [Spirochaetota bacterium]